MSSEKVVDENFLTAKKFAIYGIYQWIINFGYLYEQMKAPPEINLCIFLFYVVTYHVLVCEDDNMIF